MLAKIDEFRKSLPGYDFHIISNQGEFIGSSINEVKDSALMGIILAVIILYIFLRRVNMTLIVSLSIPISIIATFNLMYFNGLSINIMTLGGLALGAGMLVDNAIVVMENIFRNMDRKQPAAHGGSREGDLGSRGSDYGIHLNHDRGISSDRVPARCCRRVIQGTGMDG